MIQANRYHLKIEFSDVIRQTMLRLFPERAEQAAPIRHLCPSCQHIARFEYAGEQRWPEAVAKAAGLPAVQQLWTCGHCATTISNTDLDL